MDNYQKAYERYRTACQTYGIESLSINLFVKQLTEEQIYEFFKENH